MDYLLLKYTDKKAFVCARKTGHQVDSAAIVYIYGYTLPFPIFKWIIVADTSGVGGGGVYCCAGLDEILNTFYF